MGMDSVTVPEIPNKGNGKQYASFYSKVWHKFILDMQTDDR